MRISQKKWPTYRHKPLHCPACNEMVDAADCVDEGPEAPKPGDYSVCAYCGAFLRFDIAAGRRLSLRELADEEFAELPLDVIQILNKLRRNLPQVFE